MSLRSGVSAACVVVGCIGMAFALSGCKSSATATGSNRVAVAASAEPKPTLLPAPASTLAPLGFMAGQWVCVNPNKSVNREHWMSPSGQTMLGMFQQMRADGMPTLYELTAIVVEKDEVVLYHRHLHRKLGIDERRKDVDIFKLKEVTAGKVVFAPAVDQPGGIETMSYRADGPNTLVQELVFKPKSKEKNFSSVYTRE